MCLANEKGKERHHISALCYSTSALLNTIVEFLDPTSVFLTSPAFDSMPRNPQT
jgi:hypothetical protein